MSGLLTNRPEAVKIFDQMANKVGQTGRPSLVKVSVGPPIGPGWLPILPFPLITAKSHIFKPEVRIENH
jgi:hypothetical protein